MNHLLEISMDANNLQMIDPQRGIETTPEQTRGRSLYTLTQSYSLYYYLLSFANLSIEGVVLGNLLRRPIMQDRLLLEDTQTTHALLGSKSILRGGGELVLM